MNGKIERKSLNQNMIFVLNMGIEKRMIKIENQI